MESFIRHIFNVCVCVVLLDLKLCFGDTPSSSDSTSKTSSKLNNNCTQLQFQCENNGDIDNGFFYCKNGACIDKKFQCDGVAQCCDDSDESTQTCANQNTDGRCAEPSESPDKTVTFECYNGTGWKPCKGPYFPETATAIMKCNTDYLPLNHTNTVSFCRQGQWKPPIDNCYKRCEKLNPINVNLECFREDRQTPCDENSLIAGVEVKPSCKLLHIYKGFPPEYESITCQSDGKWSDPLFTCRPECGLKISKVKKLIAYGKEEQIGDSPWHVAVYENKTLICGGTIIHPSLILSAAHCFYDTDNNTKSNPERYEIVVSKFSRDYYKVDNEFQKAFKIKEIRFSDTKGYFDISNFHGGDIALLIVEETIVISPTVFPACIDPSSKRKYPPEDTLVKVGSLSENLHTANLPFISHQRCFNQVSKDFQPFITIDKFCAGSETGSGVLQGDSGGGLLVLEGDFYYVRGIVSVKQSSETRIAAFTDLTDYTRWILDVRSEIERKILKQVKSHTILSEPNQLEVPVSQGLTYSNHQGIQQGLHAFKNFAHANNEVESRPIWMSNGDGIICSKDQFQCANQQCIDFEFICDGRNDCADGSDEITFNNCRNRRCNDATFRCTYGACIDARFKCDGKEHCADGSDESNSICNRSTDLTQSPPATTYAVPTMPQTSQPSSTTHSDVYAYAVYAYAFRPSYVPTTCSLPNLDFTNIDIQCFHNNTSINCEENLLVPGTWIRPTCKPFHVYAKFVPAYSELVCQENLQWDDVLFKCKSECGLQYNANSLQLTDEGKNDKQKFRGFSWHVAIFENKRFLCAGTIVDSYVTLTAANCFYGKITKEGKVNASDYEIVVSKSTSNYTITDNADQKTYRVTEIQFKNENYLTELNYANDIAVVVTQRIQSNPSSLPVCVDNTKVETEDVENGLNNVSEEVGVGGWITNVLPIINRTQCFKMVLPVLRGYITGDKFCARLESGIPPPIAGSGWFAREEGRYIVKGIASIIDSQSGIALFTRVSDHIDWIGPKLYYS